MGGNGRNRGRDRVGGRGQCRGEVGRGRARMDREGVGGGRWETRGLQQAQRSALVCQHSSGVRFSAAV